MRKHFKKVKRILSVFLLCLMILAFWACGRAGEKKEQGQEPSLTGLTLLDGKAGAESGSSQGGAARESDGAGGGTVQEPGGQGEEAARESDGQGEVSQKEPDGPREEGSEAEGSQEPGGLPDEHGSYTTKEDVALFLHVYGRLPDNFMTKKEARALGWSGGSLEAFAPGMCIGGDRFGNYEGLLPEGSYHECDINTLGKKKRGAERLIFSDDGRIYYTGDHYQTFEILYEGE